MPECHRVVVTIHQDKDRRYTLSIDDANTGTVFGRVFRSADPAGAPAPFEVGDVLEKVGEKFRGGYIEIQLSRKR